MTELNNGIQNGAQEVSKLMLKAVFWDMDGTLIGVSSIHSKRRSFYDKKAERRAENRSRPRRILG